MIKVKKLKGYCGFCRHRARLQPGSEFQSFRVSGLPTEASGEGGVSEFQSFRVSELSINEPDDLRFWSLIE
jgi:hypothetical protein